MEYGEQEAYGKPLEIPDKNLIWDSQGRGSVA